MAQHSDKKPADADPATSETPSTAATRLSQISSHLAPKQGKKKRTPALPHDYSDILSQLATLKSIARSPNRNSRGYSRQKEAGKLWVHERIAQFFDSGSFREIGSVSGTVIWKQTGPLHEEPLQFTPSNNVQGSGTLQGRQVLLTADDFTIRGAHADGAIMEKTVYVEKLAVALKLPIIKLVDGSSGGGSVTTIRNNGWSYIPDVTHFQFVVRQLNMGIPNIGVIVGPAIGLGAARAVSCHFSVMAGDVGSLFNAGPKVVEEATFEQGLSVQDLGGPLVHCTNGTIDNLALNEIECFAQVRKVLSYLPDSGSLCPPVAACTDPADRLELGLRSMIPRRQARTYNPYDIVTAVVDHNSWFEIGALWGKTAIGGLARLDGRPVGVICTNPEVNGGTLDAGGCQKLTRLLRLCDVMNIPVLQFLDVPGYAIGTSAERSATVRWGIELAKTYFSTTMPIFSVIIRRAFGVAGGVMLGSRDPVMRVAWPSAQWGSLPLAGGIEVAHRQELKEAESRGEKAEKYRELEEEYTRLSNPVRTANAFGVEEIIDPKDTRPVCCAWACHMYGAAMQERLLERASGRIQPRFT